jgi:transcription factor-like protein
VAKLQKKEKPKEKETAESPGSTVLVRPVSHSLTERATAYFVHHYVLAGDQETELSVRGNLEYIPHLLDESGPTAISGSTAAFKAFRDITYAAGLASLANSGKSDDWLKQAYASYNSSIRHIRDALQDPAQVKLNHTLAAVMLMGTFEVVFTNCDRSIVLS